MTSKADGPALKRWLDEEVRRMPEFADTTEWAGRHGFHPVTLGRWGKGETVPSFDLMADLADELGRSFVEILLAAKVITADEAGGHPVQHTPKVTPEQAIMMDESLSPDNQTILVGLVSVLRNKGPIDVTFGR